MKIGELQALAAHTRAQIRSLEDEADMFKQHRRLYSEQGMEEDEYFCNKYLQITRKKISKLVSLQKSLKREIKAKVEMASERNALNLYYTRLHAHLDSAK